MTTPDVEFAAMTVALRPPRVAVMIPEVDNWREWVMRGLSIASEYWGGGGFIMVPYDRDSGDPSPHFRDVVRAYDPDHVVVLRVPAQDFENWHPGSIQIAGVTDENERQSLLSEIHDDIDDRAAQVAREKTVAWCSPLRSFRHRREAPSRPHETVTTLQRPPRDDRFWRGLPVMPRPTEAQRIAASADWRSDVGLLAAARVGVASSEFDERREPDPAALDWLINPDDASPIALNWSSGPESSGTEAALESWFRVDQRLMQVSRGYLEDAGGVVIGDTAADFALALAYDRILGRGIWLTPAQLADDEMFGRHIRRPMWTLISDVESSARRLVVHSTSLAEQELAAAAERLKEPEFEFQRYGGLREQVEESDTVQVRAADLERGLLELVADEHVGVALIVPMSIAEDGTREAMTGLESPIPNDLLYPNELGKLPYWYVDVAIARDHSPRGRDLPASAAQIVSEGLFPEVNLRASKHGYSFDPSSMGFVAGGALLPGRIGRPRLRSLSMRAWVEAMAETAGLGVRLSLPGRHAELVRRRLGSRKRLIELLAGPRLAVLRSFVPESDGRKDRDPNRVVLGLEPYLSFEAMATLTSEGEDGVVQLIDELSTARLLRRGLVLGCEECGRPSFLDADRVGQQYECPQCATANALVSARWRVGSEPRWFYDLHATFRELLANNGDVPLLAAARLQATSRTYLDSPELEFFELDSRRQVAEIDLVASINDEVVIVEAKANGEFSSGTRAAQTRKLLRIADVLRADRVVLATSHDRWKQADVAHVEREAAKIAPFPVRVEAMPAVGR